MKRIMPIGASVLLLLGWGWDSVAASEESAETSGAETPISADRSGLENIDLENLENIEAIAAPEEEISTSAEFASDRGTSTSASDLLDGEKDFVVGEDAIDGASAETTEESAVIAIAAPIVEVPALGEAEAYLPRVPALESADVATYIPPEEFGSIVPEEIKLRLVLRLSDRRVYVYRDDREIASYPVAVGKEGWETPTGDYEVIQLVTNPRWRSPWTGEVFDPGPDSPLGLRWIGFWTDGSNFIGFHGTPTLDSIGQAASHGCVRMRNEDIVALFDVVDMGTQVVVEP